MPAEFGIMPQWTVFKVRSLLNGEGQGLEKVGRVEAATYADAMDTAHRRWPNHVNPALPQGGLTIIEAAWLK